ncbi:MAG TPA: ABC transporter substrate-binding protein, partial [Candidatus Limnocylindrales bacterium]
MRPTFTRRKALLGSGLTLLAAAGATLPPRRAWAMPMAPLRVGVLADLTGPLSRLGKQIQTGIGYRAEALNSAGGHGGGGHGGASQIELIVADTAGDEAAAVASLLEQGVHALVGAGPRVAEA